MRGGDELDFWERSPQILNDSPLPFGVEMQVQFVDENHAGRFLKRLVAEMRIEDGGLLRHVSDHGQHAALPVAEVVERLGTLLGHFHDDFAEAGVKIQVGRALDATNDGLANHLVQ